MAYESVNMHLLLVDTLFSCRIDSVFCIRYLCDGCVWLYIIPIGIRKVELVCFAICCLKRQQRTKLTWLPSKKLSENGSKK